MRNGLHSVTTRPHGRDALLWPPPQPWSHPTFGEFLERVEHEFGSAADLSSLLLLGLGRDEQLSPADVEVLCAQLGVPPEDFGVDP